MYIHIGNNVEILSKDIIGIFDIENTTTGKNTKEFLDKSTRENRIINVSADMPKSFIVCKGDNGERVYISPISAATIKMRAASSCLHSSFT